MSDGHYTHREFLPGHFWLSYCRPSSRTTFERAHSHNSAFLIRGERTAILNDTGVWAGREEMLDNLKELLAGRTLDYIFPTHPETAHSGNAGAILDAYPNARIIGDVSDYHLTYPDHVDKLLPMAPGSSIDLGGGREFIIVPAPIKDLPTTQWGYVTKDRVLYTGDGFAFLHRGEHLPDTELTTHLPGECVMLSSEMLVKPNVEASTFVVRTAFAWAYFSSSEPILVEVDELLAKYPVDWICPAHGNVIDDVAQIVPVVRETLRLAEMV